MRQPCPTCETGPTRYTTNLVCQTCGKDYAGEFISLDKALTWVELEPSTPRMKRLAAFALSLLAFQPFAWALYAWADVTFWQFVVLCALVGVYAGIDAVVGRRLAGGAR